MDELKHSQEVVTVHDGIPQTEEMQTGAAVREQESNAQTADAKQEQKNSFKHQVVAFLKGAPKRYFITAFSGMAIGLFCTLIAGTIIEQIGKIFAAGSTVRNFFVNVGTFAKVLMGAGIGVGIAHSLKAPKMVLAGAVVAGFLGAFAKTFIAGNLATLSTKSPGDPITAYLVTVFAVEFGMLVSGKTKVDILVVPLTMLVVAGLVAAGLGKPVAQLMTWIGQGITVATKAQPFLMGIVVSASMGILLTLPTSSAAIGVAIGLSGISAGAAVAGCSAHMIGFAVASFRENKWGGLVAQGLGTSMLQIPNLGKNPRILLPAVVASIVVGPIASCAFQLVATPVGSGMGTAGLVGIIDLVSASLEVMPAWKVVVGTLVTCIILPAAVAFGVSELLRKIGWIKKDDMKIDI